MITCIKPLPVQLAEAVEDGWMDSGIGYSSKLNLVGLCKSKTPKIADFS